METRFIEQESGVRFDGTARIAEGDAVWTYRFDYLPRGVPISLKLDARGPIEVAIRPSLPDGPLLEAVDKKQDRLIANLRVRGGYPVAPYTLPQGVTPLYRIAGTKDVPVWTATVGKGTITLAAVSPAWLSTTAQTSKWLRWMVKQAYESAGGTYKESQIMRVRRGPYLGAHALGKAATIDGRYVDLFKPNLPVVEDPVLAFLVQAPSGTKGVARIWTGNRTPVGVRAVTLFGSAIPVSIDRNGDTLLVHYPNESEGVVVRLVWK